MRRQRSLDWHLLANHFRCGADTCRSKDIRLSAPAFPDRLRLERLPEIRDFIGTTDELIARLMEMNKNVHSLEAAAHARTRYEAAKRALIGWGWLLSERSD